MNIWRGIFTRLVAALPVVFAMSAISIAATVDRDYRMGDDATEGAVNGGPVATTFDSAGVPGQGQLVDLTAVNTPTYVAISGRPDGVGGRGIQFDASQSEYLHGFNLGFPEDSFSAATHTTLAGGTLDYLGISNRGFQFWVRPTSTAVQTIVMDTNRHGARINSSGKFSMRYNGRGLSIRRRGRAQYVVSRGSRASERGGEWLSDVRQWRRGSGCTRLATTTIGPIWSWERIPRATTQAIMSRFPRLSDSPEAPPNSSAALSMISRCSSSAPRRRRRRSIMARSIWLWITNSWLQRSPASRA